jgi:hypothetical protein
MKINQASTAIDCFNGRVQNDKARQHGLILSVMRVGSDYTGQQLAHLTGLTPNIISARLFEMRKAETVIRPGDRKVVCPFSRVLVNVHCKVPLQMELAA